MPPCSPPRTSGPQVEARERAAQALALRRAGHDYLTIRARCGYQSENTAQAAVKRALQRITDPLAEVELKLDLQRLDALLAAYWPDALAGTEAAARLVLLILERRARMLGYDAPTRLRHEWDRAAVQAVVEEVAAQTGRPLTTVAAEAETWLRDRRLLPSP